MRIGSKLFILIIIFIYYDHLFAQDISDRSCKRFGLLAGINVSNMDFNKGAPAPASHIKPAWESGISIGFLINIPLVSKFFLQPGYYYTQRNGADKSLEISYAIDYFSLPVLLKYKLSSHFSFLAGPQGELLIDAKQNIDGIKNIITHDVEERSITATAGMDIIIRNNFFISARYLQGLNHIGIGQRSDVKEFKYQSVNLLIGAEF